MSFAAWHVAEKSGFLMTDSTSFSEPSEEPFVQQDRFTLLRTETEGEVRLHRSNRDLSDRVYRVETVLLGLVELLHEHGIEAEEFDPDVPDWEEP